MSEIYEKLIRKKQNGKTLFLRILTVAVTVLICGAGLLWSVTAKNPLPILVLLPLSLVFAFRFVWARLSVEYEITVTSELFSIATIYGKRSRRTLLECDITDIQILAPDTQEHRARVERLKPEAEYTVKEDASVADGYLLVFEEEKNKTVLVRLDSDEELMRRVRFRKPSAVSLR